MEFQLLINIPSHGFFFPGMFVTGKLIAVNNDTPKDYRAIQVRLVGFAHVRWLERTEIGEGTRHYTAHEDYIDISRRVWEKDTSVEGGLFPIGSFEFPFSFRLLVGENLPTSFECADGKIIYKIQSQITKDVLHRPDTVNETTIKVMNVVEAYLPKLLQPRSREGTKDRGFLVLCFRPNHFPS